MSETLNELSSNYQILAGMAMNEDVDDEAIQTTLEDLNDAIEEKADGYAVIISKLKEEMDYASEKVKKWRAKQASLKRHIQFLKDNLEYNMQQTGKTKFATKDWKFNIREYQKVEVDDIGALTADYVKTTYIPDKQKIKEDLLKGKKVEGAKLEISNSLTIR